MQFLCRTLSRSHYRIFPALIACLIFSSANAQYYISTIAGNGTDGTQGDNGPAICAAVSGPTGVCADPPGNVYIVTSNSVRKVDPHTNIITTIAGSDVWGYAGDGGPATDAQMMMPFDICMDPIGNIYVSEYAGHRIRKISTEGIITTVAGTGEAGFSGDGGPASAAKLNTPHGIVADRQNNLYIADAKNARIRKIDAETGMITTIIGTGADTYTGDGGPATLASTSFPRSVAVDDEGSIYFVETAAGKSCRLRKIDVTTGIVTTLAGSDVCGFSGDGGLGINATLSSPVSVEVDVSHNVYVLEYDEPRFRRLSQSTGIITTIAGNGSKSFSGDGGLAANASLNYPMGTGRGFNGAIYIADVPNQRIRKLTQIAPDLQLSQIEIEATPELPCSGSALSFNANITNAGTAPHYQWYVNDNPTGDNNNNFVSSDLVEGDKVKCVFTSGHCNGTEIVTSEVIDVKFGAGESPTVSITSTASKVCPGETVTLTTSVQNGSNVTYQWYKNNDQVGTGGAEYTYTPVDADDGIRCDITSSGCAGGVTSTEVVSTGVYDVPEIDITPKESFVSPGAVVRFVANVSGPLLTFEWSSSETLAYGTSLDAATKPVISSHAVFYTGQTADGCIIKDSANIFVSIQMVMPNAFSPNSDGNNDVFRIPNNVKFDLKEFAVFDRWGRKIFSTADITKGWTAENARNGTYVYSIAGEIEGRKTLFKGTVLVSR